MAKKVENALISVWNKQGIIDLARTLTAIGVKLYSTGGTYKVLNEAGIGVNQLSELIDFPEILAGRVKTLHPSVFGGILARRHVAEDIDTLKKFGIPEIDMVVVNLYPFAEVIKEKEVSLETVLANIDIGGVALIRAAAKNFPDVVVVADPADYPMVTKELKDNNGTLSMATHKKLAHKAFLCTSEYDSIIAAYLAPNKPKANPGSNKEDEVLSPCFNISFIKRQELRYGENPHQRAAFYLDPRTKESSVATARQIHGKELSFNNIADLDAALEIVREFEQPAVVIIKHSNPCGVARSEELAQAYRLARECDPQAAFGGIVGLNRAVDQSTAEEIGATFIEAVIAPEFSREATEILTTKKNIRLLETGELTARQRVFMLRSVVGGMLIQDRDLGELTKEELQIVSQAQPTDQDIEAMLFAWKVAKWVKSNAIVFATANYTVGIGAGQMSRVDAVKFAIQKAQKPLQGTYMASDAFFPFRDSIDEAAKAGASAVIQPGGSKRDEEVIKAADEHGLVMAFTGQRHFRH